MYSICIGGVHFFRVFRDKEMGPGFRCLPFVEACFLLLFSLIYISAFAHFFPQFLNKYLASSFPDYTNCPARLMNCLLAGH